MEMESISSKNLLFSCWGRLKLKLPWPKRSGAADRRRSKSTAKSLTTHLDCGSSAKSLAANLDCKSIAAALSIAQPKPVGGFRYDPISYSQNFDDGSWHADGDARSRGFSSRYAAPPPPPPPQRHLSRPHELLR